MPHPRPWDFTCQKRVFLHHPEDSRSQKRSISQLQALRADSFLMDKLNPFWETELSYRCPKLSSKRPPGGGLRQSQEEWRRVAGLGRRQRMGNELLPFGQFPRAVPSSQTGTHTAASLVGLQCVFPLQNCSWKGQLCKNENRITNPSSALLQLKQSKNAVNEKQEKITSWAN